MGSTNFSGSCPCPTTARRLGSLRDDRSTPLPDPVTVGPTQWYPWPLLYVQEWETTNPHHLLCPMGSTNFSGSCPCPTTARRLGSLRDDLSTPLPDPVTVGPTQWYPWPLLYVQEWETTNPHHLLCPMGSTNFSGSCPCPTTARRLGSLRDDRSTPLPDPVTVGPTQWYPWPLLYVQEWETTNPHHLLCPMGSTNFSGSCPCPTTARRLGYLRDDRSTPLPDPVTVGPTQWYPWPLLYVQEWETTNPHHLLCPMGSTNFSGSCPCPTTARRRAI
jgi:hypothetical protein